MEKTGQNRLFCGIFTFQTISGAHKPPCLSFLNFNLKLHISTSIHAIIAPSLRHHPRPSADNLGNQRRPNPRPTRSRNRPGLRQDHPGIAQPFSGSPVSANFFISPPDKPPPNPPMYSEGQSSFGRVSFFRPVTIRFATPLWDPTTSPAATSYFNSGGVDSP